MFNNTYNRILKELTYKSRLDLQKTSKSILKKGTNSKLTKSEKDLINKIDNHIIRNHYHSFINREMVLEWCSKLFESSIYEVLSQQFIKDATKQSVSEKAQIKCMKENGFNIVKMSACGKNSLRFDENSQNLIHIKIEGLTSRSFDYKREYDGVVEYFLGKVVSHQGGHQNTVKSEIVDFLRRSNSYLKFNDNSNLVFTALVDGNSLTKIDLENYNKYTSSRVRLMNCDNYVPYKNTNTSM